MLADDHRVGDELQQAAGEGLGVLEGRRGVAEDDAELVGADAGDDIARCGRRCAFRRAPRIGRERVPAISRLAMIFKTAVAEAGAVKVVDAFEIVDVEKEHRGRAEIAAGRQHRAHMRHEAVPPREPGQLVVNIREPAIGLRQRDLMHRGDDARGLALRTAAASADQEAARLAGRIGLAQLARFDRLPVERLLQELGDDRPAQRIELVMAVAGDFAAGYAEHIEPWPVRGHILQLAVEDRGGGGEIGHKGRHPFALCLDRQFRGSAGNGRRMLAHGPRLFGRRLKNGEAENSVRQRILTRPPN